MLNDNLKISNSSTLNNSKKLWILFHWLVVDKKNPASSIYMNFLVGNISTTTATTVVKIIVGSHLLIFINLFLEISITSLQNLLASANKTNERATLPS